MTDRKEIAYVIPAQLDIETVLNTLHSNFRVAIESARKIRRSYYDTFDWRLFATLSILEHQHDGSERKLILRSLKGEGDKAQISLSRAPRFAQDLPFGRLRAQLEPLLEMRELMPLVQISSNTKPLRILNKIDKTVVRIRLEENSVRRDDGGKLQPLEDRVVVRAVKGYQKAFKKTVNVLEQTGLSLAPESLAPGALKFVGHTPGDYSSKLNINLQAGMNAGQALRVILQHLLDMLRANEAGTRKGSDTEFLHDFRVAVRRTRSALSQIKGVLPNVAVSHYKTEFAWLGQSTGPLRDVDVYLLNFAHYKDSLPESARADIEPLREFLLRHQKIEQQSLNKILQSARYRRLINSWHEFLQLDGKDDSTVRNAGRSILELASERIWRMFRHIINHGQVINDDTPAEALHELRKDCKELRYLLEFFQSLFAPEEIRKPIKTLRKLQNNLGDFQDYHVQVDTLKRFSQQMVEEASIRAETLLAMGMLVEGLERRQQQAREEFASKFKLFASKENRDHFRSLIGKGER